MAIIVSEWPYIWPFSDDYAILIEGMIVFERIFYQVERLNLYIM